ncbi:MAG: sodium:solute symporter family transporter, partial [Limisphaerales bacterium]
MENSGSFLTTLDFVVFFGSLLGVMLLGLWAGRRESSTEEFFLAGRSVRWWGVAGSIFGSNISANHMVGMMGVGFTLGFAESHFEITAIAGLL